MRLKGSLRGVGLIALCGMSGLACAEDAPSRVAAPKRLLPYMTVSTLQPPQTDGTPGYNIGAYTRLVMHYTPPDGSEAERDYRPERRDWLRRWLAGKTITRVLAVKTSLARPKLATQTMVLSAGRESNGKVGETWTTEMSSTRFITPLFRIDPESAIAIEASLSLNSSYDASAATALVDVVRRGAALVAPAAALVTSLNEKRFDDASAFIESSLRNLLKESIVEKGSNDFSLAAHAGKPLIEISISLPLGNKITPGNGASPRFAAISLGKWTISSAKPTLSVFSDVPWPESARRRPGAVKSDAACGGAEPLLQQACVAFATLDPQTVLNFPVDDNVTVGQALAGEQAIVAARDKLVIAANAAAAPAASSLCALITDKAQRLGFNRFDVAAITWAYASQSNLAANTAEFRKPANCATLNIAYSVGLPRGEFAKDPGTPPVS